MKKEFFAIVIGGLFLIGWMYFLLWSGSAILGLY